MIVLACVVVGISISIKYGFMAVCMCVSVSAGPGERPRGLSLRGPAPLVRFPLAITIRFSSSESPRTPRSVSIFNENAISVWWKK